ncbi:MAG: enoyl-CoA hydratase/isomerase family protein, partial [Lentisphaeria bacterium]|nr:enoyl-CoA hydratase/isomerase family protein [Lentisphaeria bacterium]
MTDNVILSEVDGNIATLTINRPETLNALDVPTVLELERAFAELEDRDDVRAIIVTGAGDRAVVAGGDIA